jgi:hypothetical protein
MSASKPDPKDKAHGDGGGTPFWVTRAGGRMAIIALHIAAAVAVLMEWVRPFDGDAHTLERADVLHFLSSFAVYGFVGFVFLVLVGRVLRWLVMRPADYWERDDH